MKVYFSTAVLSTVVAVVLSTTVLSDFTTSVPSTVVDLEPHAVTANVATTTKINTIFFIYNKYNKNILPSQIIIKKGTDFHISSPNNLS